MQCLMLSQILLTSTKIIMESARRTCLKGFKLKWNFLCLITYVRLRQHFRRNQLTFYTIENWKRFEIKCRPTARNFICITKYRQAVSFGLAFSNILKQTFMMWQNKENGTCGNVIIHCYSLLQFELSFILCMKFNIT